MASIDFDLINSCLVCRDSNKNSDFECLYDNDSYELSETGKLYEELFGIQISPVNLYYYPQFLCKSCELQMKLFKKLILKAIETFEALKQEFKINHENQQYIEDNSLDTYNKKESPQKHNDKVDLEYVESLESRSKLVDEYEVFDIEATDEHHENRLKSNSKDTYSQKGDNATRLQCSPKSDSDVKIEIELVQIAEDSTQESPKTRKMYTNVAYLESSDIEEESIDELRLNQTNHKARKRRTRSFKCCACAIEFCSRSDHSMHRKMMHSNKFPCPQCPKLFSTSDALSVHAKLHNNLPAYKCELCSKTFNQKVHFKYHMNKHNNVRQFKCDWCEKACISRADLNVHLRSHTDERRYTCEFCGKKFLLMQHLKMHKYSHDEAKSITCLICNQKFVSPSTLSMHMQTIHSVRQFECEKCGKKFRRKHHLIAHFKVHERAKNRRFMIDEDKCIHVSDEHILEAPIDNFEELIEIDKTVFNN